MAQAGGDGDNPVGAAWDLPTIPPLAISATYDARSALTGFVGGNSGGFAGISNSFSLNPRLQAVTMSGTTPSATVFSITYNFNTGNGDNGNIVGITNNRDNTRSLSFTYDALNRLTSAQNAGTSCSQTTPAGSGEYWGNSYGYDAWGNLLTKTVTKCSAEHLSVTALANNQLSGYGYDAAGNMTQDATTGNSYSYDQENRIAGAAGYAYTYDADGNRVEKSTSGAGTIYWYMSPGIVAESDLSGNLKSEYVFFNGRRTARKDFPSGAVSYYFSDDLETASVITNSAGTITEDEDYYPWGGEIWFVNSDSNHYKFTSQPRDSETGLDYFGARYYANWTGRFMTPDFGGPLPSSPDAVPWADLENPQTLNLYGYVRNNPISLADPDGHDCVVQSRASSSSENVSVSSGNCDNVNVGDGQTKTFVDGTVNSVTAGADGKSIDIHYTPSDGSTTGVQNANFAPVPDHTGLAYYWGNNAQGYRTLTQASMTADRIGWATVGMMGASAAAMLSGAGGALTTLGDLTITPTAGEQAYAARLLAQGGKKAVEKAIKTLSKRLAEHEAKLGGLKYGSSVEREIAGFIRTIQALSNVLK